ncbi:MAG: cupin domain-containing protein [Acidimicrobiales bacterium]|nr:cupin domain-containing protein [Acidimicrobiales bacterium]
MTDRSDAEVVDLAPLFGDATGNGVLWSLPSGAELNVNLVRLEPDAEVGEHVNDEVEVLVAVLAGSGQVTVNGLATPLHPSTLAYVPRGARRAIHAGLEPLVYLSVHRRREGLQVRGPRGR